MEDAQGDPDADAVARAFIIDNWSALWATRKDTAVQHNVAVRIEPRMVTDTGDAKVLLLTVRATETGVTVHHLGKLDWVYATLTLHACRYFTYTAGCTTASVGWL